jgi:hypothetical protein
MNNPKAASVVQQVHKVLNDIENLAGCTQAKVGESSEWTSIVKSAEENRAKFYNGLDGKPLFGALHDMYKVKLNKLKAVFKVSPQAGESGAVNITSKECMAQDHDFRKVKRRKWHVTNDASPTAKKSTRPVPTSASVKLPPKSVLTRKFSHFSELLTWTRRLLEQRTHYQSRRLPESQIGHH